MIGLDSYSKQVSIYLDPILIYISLWIDCLFEIRKIAVCFPWLSMPGDYRVTDEALLAETSLYDPPSFLWMFSLLLKDLISDFLFGTLWQPAISSQVHSNGSAITWWHTCTGQEQWRVLWTNGVQQGCVLASTLFQHPVLRHANICFSGLWWWLSKQVPFWWEVLQP